MKRLSFIILLLLVFTLQGCGLRDPKYIHLENKQSPNFYTNEVYTKILNDEDFSLEIFNTNMYKNISVSDTENMIIESFIHSLSDDDYKEGNIPTEIEPYQIRIDFSGTKYIIKVYSSSIVTLYPWDGNFQEDIISMDNVPTHYNLYDFCTYIENEAKKFK
ncbi:DUF4883 family protein [Clostridium vincentii]|uniref:Lipoprotein n=1 Tax=Clostridium vincentii TaxID=52704 RepID=A0A2T0BHR3_9CLOT|nr:DUF4883 family protein [Clostridium vincentii]PRR83411.1 hypothetical protein CLVI_09580 [Clostridium vincentii]